MRRRLYPMPIEGLVDHPDAVALPAAGIGMLYRICEHYWRTGCQPLPRDDDQLMAIARTHKPTWRAHKAAIMRVFFDLQPDLDAYWRHREGGRKGLIAASLAGGEAKKRKGLQGVPPRPFKPERETPIRQIKKMDGEIKSDPAVIWND